MNNLQVTKTLLRVGEERWPIPATLKAATMDTLADIITDKIKPVQERLSAIAVLTKLESLNLKQRQIETAASPKATLIGKMKTRDIEAAITEKQKQLQALE